MWLICAPELSKAQKPKAWHLRLSNIYTTQKDLENRASDNMASQ